MHLKSYFFGDLHTFQNSQKNISTRTAVTTTTIGMTTARPNSGLHSKKPLHVASVGVPIAADTASENPVTPTELLQRTYNRDVRIHM